MTIIHPKDAASIIIYQKHDHDIEVLMGRRRKQAIFAPGMYVFPGGTMNSADLKSSTSGHYDQKILRQLAVNRSQRRALGLAVAAIRETFEETGLLLGEVCTQEKPGQLTWPVICRSGYSIPVHLLRYLGRAITPSDSPHRYHARFYSADYADFSGELAGDGELVDLQWVSLAGQARLPMFDVTEFMLQEFREKMNGIDKGYPLLSYRGNKTRVNYS